MTSNYSIHDRNIDSKQARVQASNRYIAIRNLTTHHRVSCVGFLILNEYYFTALAWVHQSAIAERTGPSKPILATSNIAFSGRHVV
jgi:hypothetical protein